MNPTHSPVAVITGAASGIGKAFTTTLLNRGYHCIACDLDGRALTALEVEAKKNGHARALVTMLTDVRRSREIKHVARTAFAQFGHVDLLINNAGVLSSGRSWELSDTQWRNVLDINFFGVVHAIRAFVPQMIKQHGGHIVNIASLAALSSGAFIGPYSASKHALLALTETLAHELATIESALKVSVVFPNAVRTGIAQTLKKAGSQEGSFESALARIIDDGMSPEQLTDIVLDGVFAGDFSIFPHPDVRDIASRRLGHILNGQHTN